MRCPYEIINLLRTQVNGTAPLWSGEILYEGGVEWKKNLGSQGENCFSTMGQPSASAEIILQVSKL